MGVKIRMETATITKQNSIKENALRLRSNKKMLRNLKESIIKDYKEGLKEVKGYTSRGIKFSKGFFNPKSKVIHYTKKVSKKEATANHRKNYFLKLLHSDRYSSKEYIKKNIAILENTFYDDEEILKILKEVKKEVKK